MEPQLIQLAANVGLGIVMTVGFGLFLRQIVTTLMAQLKTERDQAHAESKEDRLVILEIARESAKSNAEVASAIREHTVAVRANTETLTKLRGMISEQTDILRKEQKEHVTHG